MVICLPQSCNVLLCQRIHSLLKSSYLYSPGCRVLFSYNHVFSSSHEERSAVLTTHAALLIKNTQLKDLFRPSDWKDHTLLKKEDFFRKVKLLNNSFRSSSLFTLQEFSCSFSPPRWMYRPVEDHRSFPLNLVPSLDRSLKVFLFLVYSATKKNSHTYFTAKQRYHTNFTKAEKF